MDIQTAVDIIEYGGMAASVLGAFTVGAAVTYKRMYGRRAPPDGPEDKEFDTARKIEALAGRVELLENSVRHLPTSDNIIELIKTVHEVDRRLAKIEGFVMGKEALASD